MGWKGSNQKPSPRPEQGQEPVVADWKGRGREGGMKNKTEGGRIRGQGDALSSGIPPMPPP